MCIGESWGDICDFPCLEGPLQSGGGIWDSCLSLTRLLKCKSTVQKGQSRESFWREFLLSWRVVCLSLIK